MYSAIRPSIRNLLLPILIVSLAVVLSDAAWAEEKPIYLHVFGTNVEKTHDPDRPKDVPAVSGYPWTRVATVYVYDGQQFGFSAPNDRSPAMNIVGKLQRADTGKYQGKVHFHLDDDNLTYHFDAKIDRPLEELVFIDNYYYCYLLSQSKDPYPPLKKAMAAANK